MARNETHRAELAAASLRELLRRRGLGALVGSANARVGVLVTTGSLSEYVLKESWRAPASRFGLRPMVRVIEAFHGT